MKLKDRVCLFLASAGGLGLMPIAPGSFGALLGVGMHVAVALLAPPECRLVFLITCFVVVCVAHFLLTPWAQKYWNDPDPGHFVLDEVAGYLVVPILLMNVPMVVVQNSMSIGPSTFLEPAPLWYLATAGFFVFRVFDIIKLPGARYIDRNWHGAWGVLLDDIVSGVYAAGVVWFAARFWSALFVGGGV